MGCDGCELWNNKRRICYAGRQTEGRTGFKGWPKGGFSEPELFLDRLEPALKWGPPTAGENEHKPWLNGLPRIIFLNDMGDTFSKKLPQNWMAPILFKVDWETDERHRKAQMQSLGGGYSRSERLRDELKLTGLPLGAPLKRCDGHYFIDYTEDLWQRSEGIVQGIVGLRKMIVALYSTKEGLAQLLTGGGERILLQAPAKAESPKGKAKKK